MFKAMLRKRSSFFPPTFSIQKNCSLYRNNSNDDIEISLSGFNTIAHHPLV